MTEQDNFKVRNFYNDKDPFYILAYIDLDYLFSKKLIINYINELIKKNSVLNKGIIVKNSTVILEDVKSININDHYIIKYTKSKNFNKYIDNLLNNDIKTEAKWCLFVYINKVLKKTRFYFKIHHAYTDGYNLIKLLTSPFQEIDNTKKFKRKTNILHTLYYYFIGTYILLFVTIKAFLNLLFNIFKNGENTDSENTDSENTDVNNKIKNEYIICKEFKLDEIKTFTKKNNITINDFLYALMIKTDKIYNNKERDLLTVFMINVSGTKNNINICPIINSINNSYDNNTLLKKANNTFNNLKFSLFIPILNIIFNILEKFIFMIPINYNGFLNNYDYIFSNIIGPPTDYLYSKTYFKLSNNYFIITAKSKEVIYNIMSSNNKLNIICSFKTGIIKDKKHFKKCLYKSYKDLINTK
jgi:hypothetical protein